MEKLIIVIASFVITVGVVYLLLPFAHKVGLLDLPGGRKQHKGAVPIVGGLAMAISFIFCAFFIPDTLDQYRGLLAGVFLLAVLGVADDLYSLTPKMRIAVQFFVALIAIYFGTQISTLGGIVFGYQFDLGIWGGIITIIAMLGYSNAINMLDGVDGLAGSVCFLQALLLTVLAWQYNTVSAEILGILLLSIMAFLVFNFPLKPLRRRLPKIFMGDAGSMFLGFVIAWFCIEMSQQDTSWLQPVTALWIVGYPICDLLIVAIRRIKKRASPFYPDREHLHHIFAAARFSSLSTVIIISLLSLAFGVVGVLLQLASVPPAISFLLFIVAFLAYFYLFQHAWSAKKYLRWTRSRLVGA